MSKTIGILGGMGPMATVDLFRKIIECTPARNDQEHLKIIIYNNPQIPSRNRVVKENSEDPFFEMRKSARLLETAGADFIIIPCHSAHYWIDPLRESVNIPICDMIEITADYMKEHHTADSALLFTNTGTLQRKLYHSPFQSRGLHYITPNLYEQELVVSAINSVKSGFIGGNRHIRELNDILDCYHSKGVSIVIGGCTEIPLLFPFLNQRVKVIDPTLLLAKKAIAIATES